MGGKIFTAIFLGQVPYPFRKVCPDSLAVGNVVKDPGDIVLLPEFNSAIPHALFIQFCGKTHDRAHRYGVNAKKIQFVIPSDNGIHIMDKHV